MQTVSNQNVVTIRKAKKCKEPFLSIEIENLVNAIKVLRGNRINYPAVLLYLYFAANAPDYYFAYSPQAVANEWGLPKSSIEPNFKTLVEHGFLVQRKEGSNQYDFYVTPQNIEQEEVKIEINPEVKTTGTIEFNF